MDFLHEVQFSAAIGAAHFLADLRNAALSAFSPTCPSFYIEGNSNNDFYQEFENLRIIKLVHTVFSNSIILDLKKILSLDLDSFSGEAFFQSSKIEDLFLF